MITRATLALGLVWLLAPHTPDLGPYLGVPGVAANDCDAGCGSDASAQREMIFQRLRAVRSEIQHDVYAQEKSAKEEKLSGVVEEQGEGLQNAGPIPSLFHRVRHSALNGGARS